MEPHAMVEVTEVRFVPQPPALVVMGEVVGGSDAGGRMERTFPLERSSVREVVVFFGSTEFEVDDDTGELIEPDLTGRLVQAEHFTGDPSGLST